MLILIESSYTATKNFSSLFLAKTEFSSNTKNISWLKKIINVTLCKCDIPVINFLICLVLKTFTTCLTILTFHIYGDHLAFIFK